MIDGQICIESKVLALERSCQLRLFPHRRRIVNSHSCCGPQAPRPLIGEPNIRRHQTISFEMDIKSILKVLVF
jgi:hypothetical protein